MTTPSFRAPNRSNLRYLPSSVALLAALISVSTPVLHAQSHWVTLEPDGKLAYGHYKTGDRIADFSSAGYKGGGVALPTVSTKRSISPSGKDDTAAIQQAIDDVAKLPSVDGIRGAVELATGTFHCSGTLEIATSGIVLRGAGNTAAGSTIEMTGQPHLALHIAGKLHEDTIGKSSYITDAYVPSGATSFNVSDASVLKAGDTIRIVKPVTTAWLHYMGMDALGARNGKPEHWIDGELSIRRRISAISGNSVSLEVPLMDDYDAKFLGDKSVIVSKVIVSGQLSEVGVENLRIVAPQRKVELQVDPEFDGLKMFDAADSWLSSVAFEETTNSVSIGSGTERVTVERTSVIQHIPVSSAAKPFDFATDGSQILFDRCSGSGDSTFYFATMEKQQGPVVVLHCRFTGDGHIQPHMRWFTGLLIDNCDVPGGGIDLRNRGMMGSGHGWAIGWSVIWNSSAQSFMVQQPPGSSNWSIGNRGDEINDPMPMSGTGLKGPSLHQGIIESAGKPVKPESLYLQQLLERLGPNAVKNIGY
jgi:hypothetical protein